jgi:hypothetical protein
MATTAANDNNKRILFNSSKRKPSLIKPYHQCPTPRLAVNPAIKPLALPKLQPTENTTHFNLPVQITHSVF